MVELAHELSERIKQLCARGDGCASQGLFSDALALYWKAWDLLPEPKKDWEAATWILAAIGDANFLGGDYQAGKDNLSTAMHCPDAIGNPFLHLRLGQCQFELGNFNRATDELARAYLSEGKRIFKAEDPKYLDFIKSKLDPPPGGWGEDSLD
jgi:tetratricopeptide (TPR) repeat protein